MSIYIDADAVINWEKGDFDLPSWLAARADEPAKFPATVWQQLVFGIFAWSEDRAQKRVRFLRAISPHVTIATFSRRHAIRAAQIMAALKRQPIGFADSQIAATALEDGAELLSFNREHFGRIPGLKLARID